MLQKKTSIFLKEMAGALLSIKGKEECCYVTRMLIDDYPLTKTTMIEHFIATLISTIKKHMHHAIKAALAI